MSSVKAVNELSLLDVKSGALVDVDVTYGTETPFIPVKVKIDVLFRPTIRGSPPLPCLSK
jgi:hypothetical protein